MLGIILIEVRIIARKNQKKLVKNARVLTYGFILLAFLINFYDLFLAIFLGYCIFNLIFQV